MQSLLRLALGAALLCLAWLLLSASHARASEGTGAGGSQAAALSRAVEAAERAVPLASAAAKPVSLAPVTPASHAAAHAAPAAAFGAPAGHHRAPATAGADHSRRIAIAAAAKDSTSAVRERLSKPSERPPAKVVTHLLTPTSATLRAPAAAAPKALDEAVRAADRGVAEALPVARPVLDQIVEPIVVPVLHDVVESMVEPTVKPVLHQVVESVLTGPSVLVPPGLSAPGVAALELPVPPTAPARAVPEATAAAPAQLGSAALPASGAASTLAMRALNLSYGAALMPAQATMQSRSVGLETSGGHSAPRHLPPLPTEPAAPAPSAPSATSHSASAGADPATVGLGVTAHPNVLAINGHGPVTGVSALREGPGSRPD